MDADEFRRLFGPTKPAAELTVIGSDTLPEQCPWCRQEFIYETEATDPPVMLTECQCGQWRMVFRGDQP